ncbi:hypothetical protein AgCh_001286 [Apium graveolens]
MTTLPLAKPSLKFKLKSVGRMPKKVKPAKEVEVTERAIYNCFKEFDFLPLDYEVVSTDIKGLQRMRNKASTDVSKASTDNIHQRMSASMDKASTANASTDKASTDKASTDESFNGRLVQIAVDSDNS